jgi:hypothetical protein
LGIFSKESTQSQIFKNEKGRRALLSHYNKHNQEMELPLSPYLIQVIIRGRPDELPIEWRERKNMK